METTEQITTSPANAVPALVIDLGGETHTVQPFDGPVVIGRSFPAQVVIDHAWISRMHLRLEPSPQGWTAVDTSRNGVFVGGVRESLVPITGDITLHLGNPDGFPVRLRLTEAAAADEYDDEEDDFEVTDPGVLRAGLAVARRREELELSQRWLAREKIVNGGTLGALEKGRRFPRPRTLAKLEDALQWPRGTIARLRDGESPPEAVTAVPGAVDRTAVVMDATGSTETTGSTGSTVQATLMAEAAQLALGGLNAAIQNLPAPSDSEFPARAHATLADLRRLEAVASNAARTAKGAPEVVMALSAVRKAYTDLMLTAARAPGATLGQRLFAARHHAELTQEEAASAAGVPVDIVTAAEAENPLPADAIAALETLIAALGPR
jgi:transcriptional regulator with XRE-family HTH domain